MARRHDFIHVHELRPMQMTIGMREIRDKCKHIESMSGKERRDFVEAHPIPNGARPKGRHF
ncbi:ParB-like protein [Caballeronia sp. ATUFL_M2_KS44]|uniref:ParB-like protein n=1 Tax=Caballeronia sp. ATUFL_M2_KS44 TaxID=2921767 RepID=UPI0032ED8AB7